MMGWIDYIRDASTGPALAWFLRLVALIPLYGVWRHISNLLSLDERRWVSTPPTWRALDVLLLGVDLTLAVGLFVGAPWAVVAVVIGFLAFQLVPFTAFREFFTPTPVALRRLLAAQIAAVVIIVALIVIRS